MCGRYYFRLDGEDEEINELRRKVMEKHLSGFVEGEVFPTQQALVLVAGKDGNEPSVKPWGMHGYQDKLIINARSEGIETKRTFAPYINNKCVVPCNGFYEWIKHGMKKDKIYITKKERPLQYLAGIYNHKNEFVIVTGASAHTMKQIHDRTPLLLTREQVDCYLRNEYPFVVDNDDLIFQKL